MTQTAFSYDDVPYSSFTFPQTRPDRLATLAAFHGMEPADPGRCRVLELGCGDGTNLVSFAYILPKSEFVGVDLANGHIEQAGQTSAELGLKNLSFHCEDVMDFTRERFGEFDYIIAHGLFSWVPDFVRTKVLEVYKECLAPQGVGYISYNAYPGCHIRQMIWHMMQFHTANVEAPMARVQNGVNFLNFLVHATPDDSLYQSMIKMELAQFGQRTPENIYHDDFASLNQPYYFHEFVDLLNGAELQFLSEVDSFWMESAEISPEVLKKLDELGDDIVRREQYIDFIKCRPFRSTLVCHSGIELNREPGPDILKNFYLASQVESETAEPDFTTPGILKFAGAEGGVFEVEHPLTKAALFHLQKIWSRSIRFDDLIKEASASAGGASDADVEETSVELLDLFKRGFIYLHRYRPEFPVEPSERPAASKFAQWQLRRKAADITTLSGMNLKPENDLMRLLLLLCDGTRDRAALTNEVSKRIEFTGAQKDEMIKQLPAVVKSKLAEFARLGLLES